MSAIPKLFRYVGPRLIKRAGRAINEDPSTWQTEVARAISNDHPYVDLEGSKIKMMQASPEEKKASGLIALKSGAAIHFSIRPESVRGKPELDSIEIMLDRGRLRHLNEQSYREAANNEPSKLDQNPSKNYSNPGTSNPYIGGMTGDQSPIGGHAHSQGILNSNFAHSIRNASGGVLGRFMTNSDMLARLDASLKQLNGLSQSAQMYGLHEAIGGNPKLHDSSIDEVPNAFILIRDTPSAHIMIFPNKERVSISTRELMDRLGDAFYPTMKAISLMGYAVVQNYVKMNSIDVDRLRMNTPAIQDQGWYNVSTGHPGFFQHRLKAYFCPNQISLDGSTMRKGIIFDNRGLWAEDCHCPFYGTKTYPPLIQGLGVRGQGTMWDLDRQAADGRGDHLDAMRAKNVVGPGGHAILFFEALGAATRPIKITRMADVIGAHPIIEGVTHTGEMVTMCLLDHISRPTRMDKVGLLAGANGLGYALPADVEFIWVNPTPIKLNDELVESTGAENLIGDMERAKTIKFAHIDETLWLMDKERFIDRHDLLCKIAHMGVPHNVLAKVASLKTGEEYQVKLYDPEEPVRMQKQASSEKMQRLVYNKPHLEHTLRWFAKAANEAAQGADQVAQQQPDAFDSTTVDGLLAMQFASTDTMVEIVKSESDFEEVEDKVAKMLLAAREGRTSLDEDGLVRALRGMGEANRAISQLKLELEVEGVL